MISIDEKSRALKKQKSYKENQSIDIIDDKLHALSKLKVLEEKNESRDEIDERIQTLMKLKREKENHQ